MTHYRLTQRRIARFPLAAIALCVSSLFGGVLLVPILSTPAQAQRVTVRRLPSPDDEARAVERVWLSRLPQLRGALFPGNGAILGIELRTGQLADTLGLDVSDVTPGGPADKAGITAGSRLQAINAVSLRISADDARDPMTADAGYRRLQRVLRGVDVGDTVTLRVLSEGRVETRRVATADAASLRRSAGEPAERALFFANADRASLGLSVASAGNARDTLGVFITRVTGDGPADLAGVMEGDRVAAINGVDVRVPPEDVDDPLAAAARVARFDRTLREVAAGDTVMLRVYRDGRYREVRTTAAAPTELERRIDVAWPEQLRRLELDVDRARRMRRP